MIRDVAQSEVTKEIISPGFFLGPPALRHQERIPHENLKAMQFSWQKLWFGPSTIRICLLEDVFVAGEGLVFTQSLDLIRQSINQHTQVQIELARSVIREAHKTNAIPRITGDVVLCRKPGSWNYGHWLAEMLPKAWLACQHWPHRLQVMVQAVAEPLRTVIRHSLAHLAVPEAACLETGPAPLRVERLLLIEGLTEHGTYMSPLVAECLATITAAIPPEATQRLLVTRGALPNRRLDDEPALLREAQQAGFAILDPARLPFRAQVAAFRGARRVVGVMGAAMSNLLFCPPGTEVFLLAPATMQDTFFWFITGLCRLHSVEIRCEQVPPVVGPRPWDAALRLAPEDRAAIFSEPLVFKPDLTEAIAAWFDPLWYLAHNPDVAAAGVDPVEHFFQRGWREGRNPSRRFDTARYLQSYPDVADAEINPLLHYLVYGAAEGRHFFPP